MSAQRLADALRKIVESLSEHDDEGMLEHAEQIIEARAALAAHDSDAAGGQGVPDGFMTVLVNPAFFYLMEALERADRKGYMPDAIQVAWEEFDYRPTPSPQEPK